MNTNSYPVIGWTPYTDEPVTGFDVPMPNPWSLEVTGSTCAVFRNGKAQGAGTIEKRERFSIIDPPQLMIVYKGTLRGRDDGRFAIICEANEQQIAAELAADTLSFAG